MIRSLRGPEPPRRRAPALTPDPRLDDGATSGGRIRCPKCRWSPGAHDRWGCLCGHAFHTFDTGGRCPACGELWDHTQCLRCHEWSPHDAWYADRDGARD